MSFEALGFDPAPGDSGRGQQMARRLREAANALGEMDGVLGGTGDDQWDGKAAAAFYGLVDEDLRPRVTEAYQSFSGASRALDRWLIDLDDFQSRAQVLEVEAREARESAQSAQSELAGLTKPDGDADDAVQDEFDRVKGEHQLALDNQQGALDAVLRRARALAEEANASASTTAGALETAMDVAPDEPGLLDRLGGALQDIGEFLGDVIEFVKDNWWDILHKIVNIAATVLAIASLFFPGLALAALILTVIDVAMSGVDWARGVPGAREAFLTGAVGLAGGAALGALFKAATPAINSALRTGPFTMTMATAGGPAAAAVPQVAALSVNGAYRFAVGGQMVMRMHEAKGGADSIMSLLGGNTYYDGSLSAGWQRARRS